MGDKSFYLGPLVYTGNQDWLLDNTILLVRHGSHAYGTNTLGSDLDVKGVAVAPKNVYHGFCNKFEQADKGFNLDGVIYNVVKFFHLAADCNPNIIEVLWTSPEDHLHVTDAGRQLLGIKDLFLSKKARHTFAGYAHAQLKRIRTHRRWLLHPPEAEPTRESFGLPPLRKAADREQILAAEFLHEQGYGYGTNFQELVEKEKHYRIAKAEWDQFQNWKATRNENRAALEAKYGYDTKHGMHLVRLLKMCEEILRDGWVVVKRPDAKELLGIRNGDWSYDKLVGWAEEQDARMEALYHSSKLRHEANRALLDQHCIEIVDNVLRNGSV